MRPGTGPGPPPAAVSHRAHGACRHTWGRDTAAVTSHVFPGACAENCSHLVTSVPTSRPLPSCSEDMLWSGATAVTLSCCHTVILSCCQAVTRPNTGHLAQDTSTHCKSLLTLIYNSALRAGAGRVLIGNISSVLTLHCVLWLLVCGGWCRPVLTGGFLAVSLPPAS